MLWLPAPGVRVALTVEPREGVVEAKEGLADVLRSGVFVGPLGPPFFPVDTAPVSSKRSSEEDLLALKRGLEARGMLLMLDVVVNHVGPIHNLGQAG